MESAAKNYRALDTFENLTTTNEVTYYISTADIT